MQHQESESQKLSSGEVDRADFTSPWPHFSVDEIDAVRRVLESGRVNYWTGGEVQAFENEASIYFEVRHAIALSSGSVALDVAVAALGIGPGDEVVLSPRGFIASANSVLRVGAIPVFADVDVDSQNLTAESIERVLSPATRAIIPVHLAGWPCDMPAIMDLAASRQLLVIEDCAQAHGAFVGGKLVGSFGHAAAFSFCQDKIITTGGEGGMLLTNSDDVWERAWSLKDNGKSRSQVLRADSSPGFRWVHERLGSNFRMTEMQAAIGRIQLGKLEDWVATRRAHARVLLSAFKSFSVLRTPTPGLGYVHSYYKFYTFVREDKLAEGWTRDRILTSINECGVPCFSGACPEIYREKSMQAFTRGSVSPQPVAQELGRSSLMFLVHPTLTKAQLLRSTEVIASVLDNATA